MDEREFEAIAQAEWDGMPEHIASKIQNLALLIEDEPSDEVRVREELREGETLLGLYHGIPLSERGSGYGIGATLPDTITLYRLPIIDEALELTDDHTNEFKNHVRAVVRDTLWHEVGHYMGLGEGSIREREAEGTNRFES